MTASHPQFFLENDQQSSSDTPLKSIRRHCKDCSESLKEVRNCELSQCALFSYRMGKNPYRGKQKPPSYSPPLKAIRLYCLSCCLNKPKEVRLCPAGSCAIHSFRFGKNPFVSDAKRNQGYSFKSEPKNNRFTEDFQVIFYPECQTIGADGIQKNTR